MRGMTHRRHYIRMTLRVLRLLTSRDQSAGFVRQSYDRISGGYDRAWTDHMRGLTEGLLSRLDASKGAAIIDLACGTGYATNLLAEKAGTRVVGVDGSAGMLSKATESYGDRCEFVQSDILEYLKAQPAESADIITCCWALGYSKPFAVLREIRRVLKPGGRVAIIDNSLFSLREVLYCSFLAFAEQPEELAHLMRFRFLPGARSLRLLSRLAGLRTLHLGKGSKTYMVPSGAAAIERLRATGAAAGFEHAAGENARDTVFVRFAEILEEKYGTAGGVPITHRYIEAILRRHR
jgi:ubiquinone/menaquinone biosynthesis C-methylase UbiE